MDKIKVSLACGVSFMTELVVRKGLFMTSKVNSFRFGVTLVPLRQNEVT